MAKRKTSLNIDDDIWRQWLSFVIQKTGTSRNTSSELCKALLEYMEKYKPEKT